jgi:dTDP-4-amino-4,6-dideoxygalactose transaminase
MSFSANKPDTLSPVPLLDVGRGNSEIREEVIAALAEVVDSGRFLFGPQVAQLEELVANVSQTKLAAGCASGSDALLLALMALGVGCGDEVIMPSFTFFATASCAWRLGAKPVFVDIDPRTYNIDPGKIEAAITDQTKAIIPVHLFGQSAEMDRICQIATQHSIAVVEDAAQAIGAAYHGRAVGSWGDIGCISFYPTKNLGGMGDGGMVVSDNEQLIDTLRLYAGHGMRPRYHHSVVGINSRLDTMQAAVLCIKMQRIQNYVEARQQNAQRYLDLFHEFGLTDLVSMPFVDPAAHHVWNQFSLRITDGRRDWLRSYLADRQIGSEIYYPIPLHLQECFQPLGYEEGSLPETERATREILNLPIFPELTSDEQVVVVQTIADAYQSLHHRAVA